MEGDVQQGGETSRRTIWDDRASVVDPRSRDLADSADPKLLTKSIKNHHVIKKLCNYNIALY